MSSKIIVIAAVILIIASFSVLFVIEAKNHNYDYNKSWSVVYFENPRDNSLEFMIENHEGSQASYDYKIFINDEKVIEEKVDVNAGAKQEILPVIPSEKLAGNKILIEVSYKDSNYKIYKSLK